MGVTVRVDGDKLSVSPRSALSHALADSITRSKLDLIDALAGIPGPGRTIDEASVPASAKLVPRLGSIVSTPAGEGRLVYLTIHGAVIQVSSGLMYTLDPRKVRAE